MKGTVLVIAGSDSSGGAGIQADLKTISALGSYAASAITALTAQNTQGVQAIHEIPEDFVAEQISSVLMDINIDVIKTGMLHSRGIIEKVAMCVSDIPLVVDPVMVAKGGAKLLQDDAIASLRKTLIPKATIVTPNIPEAEILAGKKIKTTEDMEVAGKALMEMGPQSVLVKGGHLDSNDIIDILVTANGIHRFKSKRINTNNTHGTGCTLASAIAANIARKKILKDAVEKSINYVKKAIESAPDIGKGHGPLNHFMAA